jgi:uracil-DNA glycosylase
MDFRTGHMERAPADTNLARLLDEIRRCRHCAADLPLGPRPVLKAAAQARILVIGQAPGTKVHETGIPWNDRSGDRLRDWMGVDRDTFYDERRIAIVPMGFCYPGRDPRGGDNPPRPECAPLWHDPILDLLPAIELTLLIGGYAQRRYLGARAAKSLTDTVTAWRSHLPGFFPTPHPSWRNTAWLKRHPWFEADALPVLRERVTALL